jgi:hypothetical protein
VGTIGQKGEQLNLMWFLALRSDSESQFRTAAGLVYFFNRINISCCQKKYTVVCLWGWTRVERRHPRHELKRMAVILPWNTFFTVEKMYATEKTTWYKSSGWLFLKPPFLVSKTSL